MNYEIGQELAVHKHRSPSFPTNDPDEIVILTVREKRSVPGVYEPTKTYEGYKATSRDGRVFQCNWENYDETGTDRVWYGDDAKGALQWWWDVTSVPGVMEYPLFFSDTDVRRLLDLCSVHRTLVYRARGCFLCKHGVQPCQHKVSYAWNGWYPVQESGGSYVLELKALMEQEAEAQSS